MKNKEILVKSFFRKPEEGRVEVSIARYAPKGWTGNHYYRLLAPSNETWRVAKAKGDWRTLYREQLNQLDVHKVLIQIDKLVCGESFALLCWEHSSSGCHRAEVAKWFIENGYEVRVT